MQLSRQILILLPKLIEIAVAKTKRDSIHYLTENLLKTRSFPRVLTCNVSITTKSKIMFMSSGQKKDEKMKLIICSFLLWMHMFCSHYWSLIIYSFSLFCQKKENTNNCVPFYRKKIKQRMYILLRSFICILLYRRWDL